MRSLEEIRRALDVATDELHADAVKAQQRMIGDNDAISRVLGNIGPNGAIFTINLTTPTVS